MEIEIANANDLYATIRRGEDEIGCLLRSPGNPNFAHIDEDLVRWLAERGWTAPHRFDSIARWIETLQRMEDATCDS